MTSSKMFYPFLLTLYKFKVCFDYILFFIFRMKLVLVSIVLCAAICVASATKVLASSSRELNRRETNIFKRIFKRQAYGGENLQRIID
jgi:hypothetical protein